MTRSRSRPPTSSRAARGRLWAHDQAVRDGGRARAGLRGHARRPWHTENEFSERTGPVAGWVLNPGTTVTVKRYVKVANTKGKFGDTEVLFTAIEGGKAQSQVVEVNAWLSMRKKNATADPDKWLVSEFCPPNKPCKVTYQDLITLSKAFFDREENLAALAERKDIALKSGIAAILGADGTGGGCFPVIVGVGQNKQPEIDIGCGMLQCNYAMVKDDWTLYSDKTALFTPAVDNEHSYYLVSTTIGNGAVGSHGYKMWARIHRPDSKCTEVMVKRGTYQPLTSIAFHTTFNNFLHIGTKKSGDWSQ